MANFALLEGALRFNPFVSIVPKADDAARRVPLDDADMTICKGNLGTVSDADQLLFRLLASTGMRLGEAFQISSEATEHGVRYVIVGTKTKSSRRRVPLPAAVLPFLPKIIKGPLFAGGAPAASKRLNKFLRDSGIATPMAASGHGTGKVVHSLRTALRTDCGPLARLWTSDTPSLVTRRMRSRTATARGIRCRC